MVIRNLKNYIVVIYVELQLSKHFHELIELYQNTDQIHFPNNHQYLFIYN